MEKHNPAVPQQGEANNLGGAAVVAKLTQVVVRYKVLARFFESFFLSSRRAMDENSVQSAVALRFLSGNVRIFIILMQPFVE